MENIFDIQKQPEDIPETNTIQTGRNPIKQLKNTKNIFNNHNDKEEIIENPFVNYEIKDIKKEEDSQKIFTPPPTTKYKIVDLYWLINPKYINKEELEKGEVQFVSISYNIIFGNLRFTFFNIPQGSIQQHIVYYNKLQRLTTGTVYNSSCAKLLYNKECKFTCMEQLFNDTGEQWQKERPMCIFEKNNEKIVLNIYDPINGNFKYIFEDWQIKTLLDSCKFCIEKGTELTGRYRITENG